MDTLNISTGEKRIMIDNDPARLIVFTPSDVVFAEKFYRLIADFQKQLTAFQKQGAELDSDNTTDENGLPSNMGDRIKLAYDACAYMREQIDSLFGPGTSQTTFGDVYSLIAIEKFFEGITPYIQVARAERVQKYTNKRPRKNGK